jgi:hypothetical protein
LRGALKRLGARAVVLTDADVVASSGEGFNSAWFYALE